MDKTVVLAGGSGFIGKHLKQYLEEKSYKVKVLSRKSYAPNQVYWDGKNLGAWVSELENIHALINLTGKSIACRWTQKNWQKICDSRTQTTSVLGKAIKMCAVPPKYWINVSGINYYVDTSLPANELSSNGKTRLALFCREWENCMYQLDHNSTQKIVLRIGFLLGKDGGAFPLLKKITQYFLGGSIGNGKQYMSWIHIDDLVRQFSWLIEKGETGFYNGVGTSPVSNAEFMRELRSTFHRPWAPPLPSFLVPVVLPLLGFEPSLVTESHYVRPQRFLQNGFEYSYTHLKDALKSLV